MTIIPSQRHLFDIPDHIAYFNCSYNAPLLLRAADALVEGARSKTHPWERKPSHFFDDAEAFRKAAATALGGDAECFAVVPSASYAASAVGRILEERMGAEDEILVLDEAFPSNYFSWLKIAQTTGASMVVAKTPEDHNWTEAVLQRISQKTKLVAVPHCHWTNGASLDLEAISIAARAVGALLALDLTQSLGARPFDFDRIQPDFAYAAGYKWLLCPYGLSLFYVAPKWHEERPLEETWLSREGAERFENLVNYSDHYQPGARRFEMGQKNIPSTVPGGVVALEQIASWGVSNIANTLENTNDKIALRLEEVGLKPIPKPFRSPHILGATASEQILEALVPALAQRHIFISRRGNSVRFAPHVHVDDNDLDRLFDTIGSIF